MLITLWNIEYSEKIPIKKLNFENSFNRLRIRIVAYFFTIFSLKNKINPAQIYTRKSNLIYERFYPL